MKLKGIRAFQSFPTCVFKSLSATTPSSSYHVLGTNLLP